MHQLSVLAGSIFVCLIFQLAIFAYADGPSGPPVDPNYCKMDSESKNCLLLSPLKQFRAGISINEIQCKDNYVKIIKLSNSFLSCVKPSSFEKLLLRGWGKSFDESQFTKTITLEDNGKTITLNVGEQFLLKLGETYDWDIEIDDQSIARRVHNIMVVRGAQGVYEAHQQGNATLSAIGNPLCLYSEPACKAPSILFKLDIHVNP